MGGDIRNNCEKHGAYINVQKCPFCMIDRLKDLVRSLGGDPNAKN